MRTVLQLTDVQRRILINQYEILAALRPKEAAYFDRCAEIIRRGYYEFWPDYVTGDLDDPMAQKELIYVMDVLEMYDRLQVSFDRLPESEKTKVAANEVLFSGFDGGSERAYMAYARFLREKMERFTTVRLDHELDSHFPTRDKYEAMLKVLPRLDGDGTLTATQIRAVLDASSA